jgi:uncharacterized protein (TIGR02453 family)
MPTAYFTPATLKFLKSLAANNNREWFHANKPEFDEVCWAPLERLAADVLIGLTKYEPAFSAQKPRDLLYRIYRDTRFSPDKTPYKTHLALSISSGGKKSEVPGLYVHIGLDEFAFYAGVYMPSSANLFKIRQEILYHHDELQKILRAKAFKDAFGDIQGEAITRPPKDFSKEDVEAIPLLKNKQFYVGAQMPKAMITSPDLASEIVRHYKIVDPMNSFFRRAIGE